MSTKLNYLKHNDDGDLKVAVTNPKTGKVDEGVGFLNPDGTFVLSFSSGAHLTGHYAFDDAGRLMIYDRKPLFIKDKAKD